MALPNDPLSDIQLLDLACTLGIKKINVVMNDEYKTLRKGQSSIVNLDRSTGGGTHWVAVYFTGKELWYFDSFGLMPPESVARSTQKTIIWNRSRYQADSSNRCGYYCLAFLLCVSVNGHSFQDFVDILDIKTLKKNETTIARILKI
jgi:hypothetical protein